MLPPHQLFSPSMNFNTTNGFSPDSPSHRKQNEGTPIPSSPSSRHTRNEDSTPTKPSYSTPPSYNGFPPRVESLSPPPNLRDASAIETIAGESNEQWSSAIGRATVGGKSGRVIDKLMGELERMRRDNKLLTVRYEEEARRSESARTLAESLQTTNANLTTICEASNTALARKDRKLEELKAELEAERSRRKRAETESKAITRERDDVVAACKKELREVKEVARKSNSQYEVLSSSWRGLDDGYRRQMQKLKDDLKALEGRRLEDQARYEQLAVVFTQLNKEAASNREAKAHVVEQFENYKRDKEDSIRQMREQAEKNEIANDKALQEIGKVMGEMKYVINVKRDVRGAE